MVQDRRHSTTLPPRRALALAALLFTAGVAWLALPSKVVTAQQPARKAKARTGRYKGPQTQSTKAALPPKNAIIFVADGLRPGSVNLNNAPTMTGLASQGVTFANSHSLFPTFTMPNGSAIATGHSIGDISSFSNTLHPGYTLTLPLPNFGLSSPPIPFQETPTPFIESDPVLGDIDLHFGGNYLDEESLLSFARMLGYNTAAVGKVGPALVQDVTQGNPSGGSVPFPTTVVIDDSTGRAGGVPLSPPVAAALTTAGLGVVTPARGANGSSGNNTTPGTTVPNAIQQQYFADAVSRVILPQFAADFASTGRPFLIVYWSRDPDGTQHNQGDSLNTLTPGINGPTSQAAVKNADNNLGEIVTELNSLGLASNTNVFVTADHGFGTISRSVVNAIGTPTTSFAATQLYANAAGIQEVNTGFLPPGFVAIDLANALALPLYDPNSYIRDAHSTPISYLPIVPTATLTPPTPTQGRRPAAGNGLVGGTGQLSPTDASLIVCANGGSNLIYIPSKDVTFTKNVVNVLLAQDYISGLFVDDDLGLIPGTLPLSAINLKGKALLPAPSIVVNFRTFSTDTTNPLMTGVEIADTTLQQGQGMHGSFGRHDTFNTMLAAGPDFKKGFVSFTPVSNSDITPTIASILGLKIPANGSLVGRAANEALVGGPSSSLSTYGILFSPPGPLNGPRTFVAYQQVGNTRYFDAAGFAGRTVGLPVIGGTSGDDTIAAGTAWAISALGGNDILIGGVNRVTLLGDGGADTFVLDPANAGLVTVGDFTREDGDKLGLPSGLTFSALRIQPGGLSGGDTYIYFGRSRLLAIVSGVTGLTASDFRAYP